MTCRRNNNYGDTTRNFIGFHLSHELGNAPTFSWSTLTQPLVCTSMKSTSNHNSMEVMRGAADMPRGDICEEKTTNSLHNVVEAPTCSEWEHPLNKGYHGQDIVSPDQELEEYVNDLVPALLMVNKSTHNMDISHRQEAFKVTADAVLARRATGMAWSDALTKRMSNYCNNTHSLAHDQNSMVNLTDLADMAMEKPDYMPSMDCASSSCIRTPVSSEGTSSCEFSDHDFGAFDHGSTASLASSDHSSMVDSTSELIQDDLDVINYVESAGEPCPLMEIACSSDAPAQRSNVTSSGEQLLSMCNIHGDSQLKSAEASDGIFKEINARLVMIRSCCKGQWEEGAERRTGSSDAAMESMDCFGGSATSLKKHAIEEAANVEPVGQSPSTELAQHDEVAPEAKLNDDVAGSLGDDKNIRHCVRGGLLDDDDVVHGMVDMVRQDGASWNMGEKYIRKSDALYADHVNYGNISDPRNAAYGFPCAIDHGEMEYFLKHGDVGGVSPSRGYRLMQYGHQGHGVSHVNEAHSGVASGHADVAYREQMHDDVVQPAHLQWTDAAHIASVLYGMTRGDADMARNPANIQQHDMAIGEAEVVLGTHDMVLPGSRTDMRPGKQRRKNMAFCNADADQGERGSVAIADVAGQEVMCSAASDGIADEVEVHAGDVDAEVDIKSKGDGKSMLGKGGGTMMYMAAKDDMADELAHGSEVYADVEGGGEWNGSGSHGGINIKMREMMYRVAAYQPIDWGSIMEEVVGKGRPKRKNVRISKEPQSIAARRRRERISDRIHILQRLVPGATKLDTASMLDEAIHYLKFLKLQVHALGRLDKYFTASLPPLATTSPSHFPPFYPFNYPPSAATSSFPLKS